jgi:hypothetical protein
MKNNQVTVTVILSIFGTKKTILRNVPFNDAMKMIEGRTGYKLIFGPY